MRQQAIATLVAAACMTGPLAAQTTENAMETLADLVNWSGAAGTAPNDMTNLMVGLDRAASECVLYFDVGFDENTASLDVRISAPIAALDPNQVFIWDQADVQRLNISSIDGPEVWTAAAQIDQTHSLFARAYNMVANDEADGSCTANSCTLITGGRPLEMPLPSLTTEDDIVATTVALQTLITQCGGSADTADN